MAEYDRHICEDYVARALKFGYSTFVRLWMHAIGMVPMSYKLMTSLPQLDSMVVEWETMKPWNRQDVLFLMAIHLDKIARQKAMEASLQARIIDPI
jgi:hypothetical protein